MNETKLKQCAVQKGLYLRLYRAPGGLLLATLKRLTDSEPVYRSQTWLNEARAEAHVRQFIDTYTPEPSSEIKDSQN